MRPWRIQLKTLGLVTPLNPVALAVLQLLQLLEKLQEELPRLSVKDRDGEGLRSPFSRSTSLRLRAAVAGDRCAQRQRSVGRAADTSRPAPSCSRG